MDELASWLRSQNDSPLILDQAPESLDRRGVKTVRALLEPDQRPLNELFDEHRKVLVLSTNLHPRTDEAVAFELNGMHLGELPANFFVDSQVDRSPEQAIFERFTR